MPLKYIPSNQLTLLVISFIASFLIVGIPLANYVKPVILEKNSESFLTASVVVLAAIVGIVFSISLVVMQNTASNYSPTMLRSFRKDWFVAFTLAFSLVTIGVIGSTVLFGWDLIILCWIIFFWDLALVGIYLYYTLNKINPLYIVEEIKNLSSIYLKRLSSKIDDIIKKERREDHTGIIRDLQDNLASSIIVSAVLKKNYDLITPVKKYETTLHHIILGSYRKDDFETSTYALNVYPTLVENYLNVNPESNWYDDEFLNMILQRFDVYAEKTITNNSLAFLKEVIINCKNIGKKLSNIPSSRNGMETILPLALSINTLARIGQQSLAHQMYDGTTSALIAIKELGEIGLRSHRNDHLASNKILGISELTLKIHDAYTTSVCILQLFVLVQVMISTLRPPHIRVEIKNLTNLIQKYIQTGLSDYYIIGLFSEISEVGVIPCVREAISLKNGEFPLIQTRAREEDEKQIISEIISMLRNLTSGSTTNSLIVKDCADNLVQIASLCVGEEFRTFDDGHRQELLQIISALLGIYRIDRNNSTFLSDDIISNIMEVAVLSATGGYADLPMLIVDRIQNLGLKVLAIDEMGHMANRINKELNILGCYAIMASDEELLNKVVSVIIEFDQRFEEKFKHVPPDLLDLDHPSYVVDLYDRRYRYIDSNAIMQQNNRINFELSVLRQRLEVLRARHERRTR